MRVQNMQYTSNSMSDRKCIRRLTINHHPRLHALVKRPQHQYELARAVIFREKSPEKRATDRVERLKKNQRMRCLFCSAAFSCSCRKVKITSTVLRDERNPHCASGRTSFPTSTQYNTKIKLKLNNIYYSLYHNMASYCGRTHYGDVPLNLV